MDGKQNRIFDQRRRLLVTPPTWGDSLICGFIWRSWDARIWKSSYAVSTGTDGLRVKDHEYENGTNAVTVDRTPITLLFNRFFGAKVELCPEWFLTPRLALTGVLGCIMTTGATVHFAHEKYANWEFDNKFFNSNYNNYASDLHLGFDPSKAPEGDLWELFFSRPCGGLSRRLFF